MKNAEYLVRVIIEGNRSLEEKQQLIKDYAKQVAEQALKDASEKIEYNRITITSTEIITP